MAYDKERVYFRGDLAEPNVWANLTSDQTVIFQDNDFEIFLDASSSTHNYKEHEMNANANLWTLALAKPYGDGGYENSSRVMSPGFDSLSYPTTERQIIVEPPSCINDPAAAPCVGWTSFLALPHASILLNATTDRATREPNVPPPEPGSIWRADFSRVEWQVLSTPAGYVKDPVYPNEDNWVWAPTGVINIHEPERWGILHFTDEKGNPNSPALDEYISTFGLRDRAVQVYYAQHAYASDNGGNFTTDVALLRPYVTVPNGLDQSCGETIKITLPTPTTFLAIVDLPYLGTAEIDQERFLTCT